MLPLLFAAVVFFFLAIGAVVFVLCLPLRITRRYALSAALWCAVWGPCVVGWMTLAGLAVITEMFITRNRDVERLHAPTLPPGFGWGYVGLAVLGTVVVASVVAWVHQVLMRRTTFALFRLYAAVVSAGIGSVFGWSLVFWMLTLPPFKGSMALGIAAMLLLMAAFGVAAYRGAGELRGDAPRGFTWITPEEYAGS